MTTYCPAVAHILGIFHMLNQQIWMQVYVTMYLNDCQRSAFYEGIGLDAKEFDMHVIIEVSVILLPGLNSSLSS